MYVCIYVSMYACMCMCVCVYVCALCVHHYVCICMHLWWDRGARCSSMVRAFAHGAMYRRIDPS